MPLGLAVFGFLWGGERAGDALILGEWWMVEGGREGTIVLILFLSLPGPVEGGGGNRETDGQVTPEAGGKVSALPDPKRPTVRGEVSAI